MYRVRSSLPLLDCLVASEYVFQLNFELRMRRKVNGRRARKRLPSRQVSCELSPCRSQAQLQQAACHPKAWIGSCPFSPRRKVSELFSSNIADLLNTFGDNTWLLISQSQTPSNPSYVPLVRDASPGIDETYTFSNNNHMGIKVQKLNHSMPMTT